MLTAVEPDAASRGERRRLALSLRRLLLRHVHRELLLVHRELFLRMDGLCLRRRGPCVAAQVEIESKVRKRFITM
jgi:hypothetical protein